LEYFDLEKKKRKIKEKKGIMEIIQIYLLTLLITAGEFPSTFGFVVRHRSLIPSTVDSIGLLIRKHIDFKDTSNSRVRRDALPYPRPVPKGSGGQHNNHKESSSSTYARKNLEVDQIGIAFTILAGVLILALIVTLVFCYWRKKH